MRCYTLFISLRGWRGFSNSNVSDIPRAADEHHQERFQITEQTDWTADLSILPAGAMHQLTRLISGLAEQTVSIRCTSAPTRCTVFGPAVTARFPPRQSYIRYPQSVPVHRSKVLSRSSVSAVIVQCRTP